MRLRTKLLGSAVVILLLAGLALVGYWRYWPQTPPASQHGLVEQQVARTTVIVDYNRPVAHGREPFGDTVAWGQIWTPSAERPAIIRLSTDVQMNGQPIAKGNYSIWAQPRMDAWTVILSRNVDLDRASYHEGEDALRLTVTPRSGPHMDTLAFYFPMVDGHAAELDLHWGRVVVPIQITVP
jgi:hypothetical protein